MPVRESSQGEPARGGARPALWSPAGLTSRESGGLCAVAMEGTGETDPVAEKRIRTLSPALGPSYLVCSGRERSSMTDRLPAPSS